MMKLTQMNPVVVLMEEVSLDLVAHPIRLVTDQKMANLTPPIANETLPVEMVSALIASTSQTRY